MVTDGDILSDYVEDLEGTIISRLEGLLHSINPDEHVRAVVEVAVADGLRW